MTASLARTTAEAYVERVNAVDLDGLMDLFAEDAVLFHPFGEYEGREALREFYADKVLAFAPQVTASNWVEQGRTCVFDMAAQADGASSHVVDHLTVDDSGRIIRLEIGIF